MNSTENSTDDARIISEEYTGEMYHDLRLVGDMLHMMGLKTEIPDKASGESYVNNLKEVVGATTDALIMAGGPIPDEIPGIIGEMLGAAMLLIGFAQECVEDVTTKTRE